MQRLGGLYTRIDDSSIGSVWGRSGAKGGDDWGYFDIRFIQLGNSYY